MKRKLLALALVLSLAFSLFGCGQGTDIRKEAQDGEEKLVSTQECHLLLRLNAGSPVELYLDESETVLKAAGEEDFLAELELAGMSYADAVAAILQRAGERGLLTETAEVTIDVLASAAGPLTLEQTRRLEQAVSAYDAGLTSFADQRTVVAADCGAETVKVETLANGDLFYNYYVNGVAVREVCYGADGSYKEWVYDGMLTTDTIYISPDGGRSEEHLTYDGGELIAWSHTVQEGDRSSTVEERYENGQVSCKIHTVQDGDRSSTEEERYENGQVSYFSLRDSNGYAAEITYYSDGRPRTEEEHNPNGEAYVYRYRAYEADGSCLSTETAKDGTVLECRNNANGMETYRRCTYANGDWMERTYHPNGSTKTEEGSTGGAYYCFRYDENGMLIEE